MSKISGNLLFGEKKAPAGCPDRKTKVVNIFRNIPDPTWTPFGPHYIPKLLFNKEFNENRRFSNKVAKQIKIVAKAKVRTRPVLKQECDRTSMNHSDSRNVA